MRKTIRIEGMMCANCVKHVKNALEALPGVKAEVSLKNKTAVVEFSGDVTDEMLKKAVTDEEYEVVGIE